MNQIPLSQDDPRLSAYAFDEMPPAERAEFEQLLQRDPAARQAVEEIRAAGAMLEQALEHEPVQFHPVAPPASKPAGSMGKVVRFPQLYYMVSGLAAACFAVFFVYWQTGKPLHEKPKQYVKVELGNAGAAKPGEMEAIAVALPPAPPPVAALEPGASAPSQVAGMDLALPTGLAEISRDALEKEKLFNVGDSRMAFSHGSYSDGDAKAKQSIEHAAREDMYKRQLAQAEVDGIRARKSANEASLRAGYEVAGMPPPAASARVSTSLKDIGSEARVGTSSFGKVWGSSAPVRDYISAPETAGNTEAYGYHKDNDFLGVRENPLSTFSIDVDTAAYANVRRFLTSGQRPPRDAVRIEEMVNYFPYQYRGPTAEVPFAANLEVASAPWAPEHRLVRIGLKGREVSDATRPAANLVFLLDVSGSMQRPNKLPLVKQSLRLLVDKLRADDRVAIAVYAGASGLALPSTPLSRKAEVLAAIDRLEAGGSTNGAMGIQLAYDIAKANFVAGGLNRVILATDGDFNVGVTSEGDLVRLIEEKAKSGVFLSVLGFGMGNLKDSTLEKLADKGNGNYAYIDTLAEAKKSLVEQAGGTLMTIAKDVKIQVEFNPAQVQAYRLIGYENRLLAKEDFNNDKIDAGEIGAGHTVTALYEVVPVDAEMPETGAVDPLKYQKTEDRMRKTDLTGEMLTVKIRYKEPAADESRKLEFPLRDTGVRFENATEDFKFAAAVAGFGMILRDSPHKGTATLADISAWGRQGISNDAGGYRSEFLGLVQKAEALQ